MAVVYAHDVVEADMTRRNFWNLLTAAVAILGALLLCNYPVCEGDSSLCAIKSEAT